MRKINLADADFILRGDKSLKAVRTWTEGLFARKEAENFIIPKEICDWFFEIVSCAYKKAENDLIRRMILVKIIHTWEVVRAGFDITGGDTSFEWNKNQVGTVCLLHDIARFDQALLGSLSDIQTKYDHATEGSKMITEHVFSSFESVGVDKKSVVESVFCHSRYGYLGNDVYAKLIRDADKLALLRAMPEIIAAKIEGFVDKGVTEAALRAYKNGKMVHNEDMITRADMFLAWLGWESDFNFSRTDKYFVDEGIKEWMTGELALLGVEI